MSGDNNDPCYEWNEKAALETSYEAVRRVLRLDEAGRIESEPVQAAYMRASQLYNDLTNEPNNDLVRRYLLMLLIDEEVNP